MAARLQVHALRDCAPIEKRMNTLDGNHASMKSIHITSDHTTEIKNSKSPMMSFEAFPHNDGPPALRGPTKGLRIHGANERGPTKGLGISGADGGSTLGDRCPY